MKIIKLWEYWACHALNFLKQMSISDKSKKNLYISTYNVLFQLKIFQLELLKEFIEDNNFRRSFDKNETS